MGDARHLPKYDRSWLRFDVIAGATVWGLLVPESIAYAVFGTSRHVVAGCDVGGRRAARLLGGRVDSASRDCRLQPRLSRKAGWRRSIVAQSQRGEPRGRCGM
jgi:hypothetical protein